MALVTVSSCSPGRSLKKSLYSHVTRAVIVIDIIKDFLSFPSIEHSEFLHLKKAPWLPSGVSVNQFF